MAIRREAPGIKGQPFSAEEQFIIAANSPFGLEISSNNFEKQKSEGSSLLTLIS